MPMSKWTDPTFLEFYRKGGIKDPNSAYKHSIMYRIRGEKPPAPTPLELQMILHPSTQYEFDPSSGIKTGR